MVGGAILRRLEARKAAGEDLELITRTSSELDLTNQVAVRDFMTSHGSIMEEMGAPEVTRTLLSELEPPSLRVAARNAHSYPHSDANAPTARTDCGPPLAV